MIKKPQGPMTRGYYGNPLMISKVLDAAEAAQASQFIESQKVQANKNRAAADKQSRKRFKRINDQIRRERGQQSVEDSALYKSFLKGSYE